MSSTQLKTLERELAKKVTAHMRAEDKARAHREKGRELTAAKEQAYQDCVAARKAVREAKKQVSAARKPAKSKKAPENKARKLKAGKKA